MLDVLVAADLCLDLMLTGNVRPRFNQFEQLVDGYSLDLGGSANIFAAQFARLGGSAGLIGRVGDDPFGKFIVERLAQTGVDTSRVSIQPGLQTGLGLQLVEGNDRAMLTYTGSIDAVEPRDLPWDPAAICRHWHVASYFLMSRLRPHWREWLERCRAAGLTTSFDPNWDPADRWEGVQELLPLIDLLFVNDAEACALTGTADAAEAGLRLASRGPLVAAKLGERGALAVAGERVWQAAPLPVPAIADTVGAGDNFDAGFLRAWLLRRDVPECLALGQRCAAASLSVPGGIAGQLKERVDVQIA
jgi:sugar/nucleoside kinase (ribokinase family)